jgi:hypothetical protein
MKHVTTKCVTVLSAMIFGLVAQLAWAQTADLGAIRGVVTDSGGAALPGVTISAISADAPGVHTAVSEGDGQYRLLNLPPGVFTVTAKAASFESSVKPDIAIRAGLNLTVNFAMQPGSVQQTVTVSSDTSILETEQPEIAAYIAADFQRELPLSTRHDLSDALEVTPGVAARTFISNNGNQVYMLRGTDVEQHVVLIDGADMGSSRQGRTDFVNFSALSVADSEAKTGGGDATQPLGLGVVLSVETKTGTNQFHGAVGSSYQNRAWNGNNDPLGVPTISEGFDPEGAIGGPILRNRLWFNSSFRYLHRQTQISRSQTQLTNLTAVQPGWQPFDNRSRTRSSFNKVTLQLSQKHQLSGFYLYEGGYEDGNQSTNIIPLSNGTVGGSGYSLRLISSWSNTLTSSIGASYNNISATATRSSYNGLDYGGPQLLLYNADKASAGTLVGNGLLATTGNNQNFAVTPSNKMTIGGSVNWLKTGWWGSHEFEGGIFIQPMLHLTTQTYYLNGGYILEEEVLKTPGNLTSGYVPFHKRYVDPTKLNYLSADSNSRDYGEYVQDSWKPVPRLSIVAGFRMDHIWAYDNLFSAQTQSSYEPQPRVGVTYSLTKDGKNVVHGSYSRIAAKPEPAFLPSLGGSVTTTTTDYYDTAGNGTFSTVLVTPAQSSVSATKRIDPNRHQERTDEYLAGFRRQFPGQISFDGTFIQRYYRQMPAQIDVNGIYQNNLFVGYTDPTQNAILSQTNNIWNTPVYTAFEFTAQQRTSKSQFIFGYTRTFQHLEGSYQPTDPALYIQPSTFADNAGIGTIRGNENNSLSGTAETRNPMWIPHVLRVAGSYNLPRGFIVSSNFNLLAGPWTGPIVKYLSAPDPAFGPSTITLSNGRVVSNPLATTVRFAYSDRGTGQLQAPTLLFWDSRLSKTFKISDSKNFEVGANITNITNNATQQEFLGGSSTTASTGSNQIGSINFAYNAQGVFQGQNRQAARAFQLTGKFVF